MTNRNTKKQNYTWDEYHLEVLSRIANGENLFITGKAGTGKTTLLREIKRQYEGEKIIAVVAPTGVAAENAGGFTLHSFLRIPMKPYLPDHKVCPELYQLDESAAEVVRKIDILIIDEVSMVRCDMLDAADKILQHYRGSAKPFGGLQLIMFGDLFQLSPVVPFDEDVHLSEYYKSPYFFCSYALKKLDWRVVELKNVYRQKATSFVEMLNRVRTATVTLNDIRTLDKHYDPDFQPDVDDDVVTLTTHIKKAKRWNNQMFAKLAGKSRIYAGTKRGFFREHYPVPMELELKVGARVMFLRNDNHEKRYVNGTMGWITRMEEDGVVVRKDNGDVVYVERATWEQYDYHVDKKTKTIFTEVSATYSQIPLKLAWAVSIHKSQGLTFDEVAIDAKDAFVSGQVYVALSRCRSMKGLHLLTHIPSQKITVDPFVMQFMDSIDADGKVNFDFELFEEEFEPEPLQLTVRDSKYEKIKEGSLKNFHRNIDLDLSRQLFKHEGSKICVNEMFKGIKKTWKFSDHNNGHCPFIIRKYKTVVFESWSYMPFCAEIDPIEVIGKENSNGIFNWNMKFRILKIIK